MCGFHVGAELGRGVEDGDGYRARHQAGFNRALAVGSADVAARAETLFIRLLDELR